MPLRPIELRSQERTWDALQGWLYSWSELRSLASSQSVATWEVRHRRRTSMRPSTNISFLDCGTLSGVVACTKRQYSIHAIADSGMEILVLVSLLYD